MRKILILIAILSSNSIVIAQEYTTSNDNLSVSAKQDDLFLEDINGEAALGWVNDQNFRSLTKLENDPRYEALKEKFLKNLNGQDRLLEVSIRKGYAYNFLKDEKNPRGIYRSSKLKDYLEGKPVWEILLDLDKVANEENENWVLSEFYPFGDRALLALSRGGKDAVVIREYDFKTKEFVPGGFYLPEGKHEVYWIDENTVMVGLADPSELTESGYPSKIRLWRRGSDISSAEVVFEGDKKDVSVYVEINREYTDGPISQIFFGSWIDFFNAKIFLKTNAGIVEIGIPTDAKLKYDKGFLFLNLMSDWNIGAKTYPTGTLLRIDLEEFLTANYRFEILFTPTKTKALSNFEVFDGHILVGISEDVSVHWSELFKNNLGEWIEQPFALPANSDVGLYDFSQDDGLAVFSASGFLTPTSHYIYDFNTQELKLFEKASDRFDATPYKVEQFFATSLDGTRVPYYMVSRKDLQLNGNNPTLINAYGGFEISENPFYSFSIGIGWLEQGGVFVLANIRGGIEYGPSWHSSAIKENRQRCFDDFHAVAMDLISRQVTQPKRLGIFGASNGGLLMGVAVTQRPDLYGAAAIEVPLLDMIRYHKLLAGASWVGEYGDPEDPIMGEVLLKYSPYHNVFPDKKYPEVFFMTSTADDRVHPGHARRMAYKMALQEHPFLFYENTEGGHGGTANNEQEAKWEALQYVYFLQKLMGN